MIPPDAAAIHGITTEIANETGITMNTLLDAFHSDLIAENVEIIVAHNIRFDDPVIQSEMWRGSAKNQSQSHSHNQLLELFMSMERRCTMLTGTLPGERWPRLADLYLRYFGVIPQGCHRADSDVEFCAKIYFAMVEAGLCFRN